MFSGQGTQHPEMFAGLPDDDTVASLVREACDAAGLSLQDRHLPDDARIFDNRCAQPLIVGHALACWAVLREALPSPSAFVGYSVGEVAAISAAGALPAEAAIRLAAVRAELMEEAVDVPQSMFAVRGRVSDLDALSRDHGAWVSIDNGPEHQVISGPVTNLAALKYALQDGPASVRDIDVTVASHCPLMEAALPPFRVALDAALEKPARRFVSAWSGKAPRDIPALAEALTAQISAPLRWAYTLQAVRERGVTVWLEVGCGNALARIATELSPDVPTRSIADFRSLDEAIAWAQRLDQASRVS